MGSDTKRQSTIYDTKNIIGAGKELGGYPSTRATSFFKRYLATYQPRTRRRQVFGIIPSIPFPLPLGVFGFQAGTLHGHK